MNVPEKNRVETAAVASQVLLTGCKKRVTATALAGLLGDFFYGLRFAGHRAVPRPRRHSCHETFFAECVAFV